MKAKNQRLVDLKLLFSILRLLARGKIPFAVLQWICCLSTAMAQTEGLATLTNVAQIRRLSASEASKSYPVRLQAEITYADPGWGMLFVQDQRDGIYIFLAAFTGQLTNGQTVEVTGHTGQGMYSHIIINSRLTPARFEGWVSPQPRLTTLSRLNTGQEDARLVTLETVIRHGQIIDDYLYLDGSFGSSRCEIVIPKARPHPDSLPQAEGREGWLDWVDARIKVTGVCGVRVNQQSQLQIGDYGRLVKCTGKLLDVGSSEGLQFFTCLADGEPIRAELPTRRGSLPELRVDSKVEVTGLAFFEAASPRLRRAGPPSQLRLLLRSPSDVEVLAGPPWWNATRIWTALLLAIGLLTAPALWLLTLRRQVARQMEIIAQQLRQTSALSNLGHELSLATTAEQAARIVTRVAEELLGWDAASLNLYSPADNTMKSVLNIDTVNGQRMEVTNYGAKSPSPMMLKVVDEGPKLILRDPEQIRGAANRDGLLPFGNKERLSLSLMFVPIRTVSQFAGMLSIQRYRPHAYDEGDLKTLGVLGDYCGGALERIQAEEVLREKDRNFRAALERSMEGLQRSEGLLRQVLDSLPVGVWVADRNGTILLRNAAGGRIWARVGEGVGPGNMPERAWRRTGELILKEQWPLARVLGGEGATHNELVECELPDGARISVRISAVPIQDAAGGLNGAIVVHEEVTHQLKLEEELRHAQKMESIGQLAAGVAHEFNNILTIVRGYAALAQDCPEISASAETQRWIDQIIIGADRASKLTSQLLAFSRKQMMHFTEVDLGALVGSIAGMLARLLGENIQLEYKAASGLPMIYADSGMMEQIIINLALNSRDAMPGGGSLKIKVEKEVVPAGAGRAELAAGEYVCLSVADNGSGMSSIVQRRIFDPFFTTKEVGKGSGLGLAMVYGIVKQHNGWIDVNSAPGKGSVFKIYLPVHQTGKNCWTEPSRESSVPGGSETILIVEDESDLRSFIASALERYGYRVYTASNGVEALRLWNEIRGKVDLLFTDMLMPEGLSGEELAQELTRSKPNLKVVYTSGYRVKRDGMEDNGTSFLPKPFTPVQMAKMIRDCLDGRN